MMTKTQPHVTDTTVSQIMNEVKKNGFYTSFCEDIVTGVDNLNDIVIMIKNIAKNAHLEVNFNASESVCIFEAPDE